VLASLVILGFGADARAAPRSKQRITVAKQPVTVTLGADTTKPVVGEPVTLTFGVANGGAATVSLRSGPLGNGAPDGFTVTVKGPKGGGTPVPPNPMAGNGGSGFIEIAPKTAAVDRILLPEWFTIAQAGRYTVTVARKLKLGGDAKTATDFPVRLELVLDVAVATPEKLGAAIDRLAARMLAADEEAGGAAAEALATIKDARVVPHLVKALALDWRRQFPAIRALADYPTPESLAALQKLLASVDFNTRISAAQSIAAHKTDAGLAVLWGLRKDKNESMRLEVVHAIAHKNPPDAEAKLTEMSKDTSAMVSGEAKRHLAERKKSGASQAPPR